MTLNFSSKTPLKKSPVLTYNTEISIKKKKLLKVKEININKYNQYTIIDLLCDEITKSKEVIDLSYLNKINIKTDKTILKNYVIGDILFKETDKGLKIRLTNDIF